MITSSPTHVGFGKGYCGGARLPRMRQGSFRIRETLDFARQVFICRKRPSAGTVRLVVTEMVRDFAAGSLITFETLVGPEENRRSRRMKEH